jgi:hypothetical protein
MKGKRLLYLLSAVLLLSSCGIKPLVYYPLEEGMSWVYRIDKNENQEVENFAVRKMGTMEVVPQKIETAKGSAFRFIAVDKEGIFEYARQSVSASEPEILNKPEYILKQPLKPGSIWEEEADIALLLERIPYTMKYLVESNKETVTVPAGTFDNCLLIKGSGLAQKDKGALGIIKIAVTEDRWYAPGVGLIKSVRKESGNHVLASSGEKVVQLISYQR